MGFPHILVVVVVHESGNWGSHCFCTFSPTLILRQRINAAMALVISLALDHCAPGALVVLLWQGLLFNLLSPKIHNTGK